MREALEQWDGAAASAADLRARFRTSPVAEGRVADGDRGLSKIRRAYDAPGDPASLVRWLAKNPDELGPLAPLLGDPALGEWPWADAVTVDDELATATLDVLARVQVLASPELRRFLRVLLRVRPRPLWTAAARAMARQAQGDAELDATVQGLWAEAFPETLALGGGKTRLRRHALYLGACHAALGGSLRGPDPRGLASAPLPKDDADRSVVLSSLVALRHDPAVAPVLRERLADRKHGPLSERAVVLAWPLLDEATQAAVRDSFSRDRWKTPDGLLAWMDTARALGLQGLEAGPATRAMALAIEPVGTPLDLVEVLKECLDPVLSPLVPPRRRACALAEAVALLEAPQVRGVPWPDIARATGDFVVEIPGRAIEVGARAIGITAALHAAPVEHLLRIGDLGVEGMLRVAGRDNPFVATQVAVQMEIALRRAADDSERLRLLWRLLQRDPPSRTFRELDDMLRADARPGEPASSPLIEIARAVAALYQHRAEVPARELAEAMRSLATRLDALDVAQGPPLRALADLVEAPPETAVEALSALLGDGPGGLLRWTAWLDGDSAALAGQIVTAAAATEELRATQANLEAARPLIDAVHAAEVRRACEKVGACVEGCGWPERHAVAFVLGRIAARAHADLHAGHRARAEAHALDDALRLGDEAAIHARIAKPDLLAFHTPADLRRIHRFLLDQMDWAAARRLRLAVRERLALPSLVAHFLPMLTAIAGGALLVQDFGTKWVDEAEKIDGMSREHVATVFLATAMAWATLTATLARRFHGRSAWSTVLARSTPVFLAATVVALVSDGLVLLTLAELEVGTFIVGGALALFLGVFVGLVLPSQAQPRD